MSSREVGARPQHGSHTAPAPVSLPDRLRGWLEPPEFARVVTAGEVLALGLVTVTAVVAAVSLATAHLAVLTLTSVVVGSAAVLAVLALLLRLAGPLPRVVWDPLELVVLAGATVVALWFYLPGFHYAAGDRDPGGYVMHAIEMARGHSYDFTDPVLAQGLPVQVSSPNARFAGVWVADASTGRIVPQFYHLWPALLATSWNLGGWDGIATTTPLIGVVAALLAVVLARRVVAGAGPVGGAMSLVAASVTGLLMGTNMLQVWQAKYPTSEILAQALFTGALLCLVIAIQTRWRWPAAIAGLFVGVGYLNRADGVLLVLGLVGLGAVLWVLGRFDVRAWWCAAGLGVLLPYGMWQAYGPARAYTAANLPLTLPLLLGMLVVVFIAALLLRPVWGRLARGVQARMEDARTQRIAGAVFTLGALGLFALGLARPFLFGPDYQLNNVGERVRTLDERTLYRLEWFFTWPGWLLMLGGVAWMALRRRATSWVVLAPLAVLLPLYALHARNSTYFMWWGRRFIPTVIVGIVLAVACAVAWLATRWLAPRVAGRGGDLLRYGGPVVAVLLFLPMLYTGVQQSRPLQSHDEWADAYGVERELVSLAGGASGVWLWNQNGGRCCDQAYLKVGAPMWLIWEQLSVLMPSQPNMVPGYVKTYVDRFQDQPVFLVYESGDVPPELPGVVLTPLETLSGTMRHWDESSIKVPTGPVSVPYAIDVYRATAA